MALRNDTLKESPLKTIALGMNLAAILVSLNTNQRVRTEMKT